MSDKEYDSLSEYFTEQVKIDDRGTGPTPLEVVDESKFLDDPLGQILIGVYKRGEVTLEEVASEVGVSETKIKRHLSELRLQGYLGLEYRSGQKYYYVRDNWDTEEFPSGPIIPLVYQYNLLSDEQRLGSIKEAIETHVSEGDIVADLGAGVGALSYLAAETAEKVYAVEIDREVYEKGREIMAGSDLGNVEYIRGDAREVDLPERVDVVMCEMLDTALVAELQVPVMNYAIEELLAEDGIVIPHEARTSAQLVNSDYEFYGGEFRLPHFEEYGSRESTSFSEAVTYHTVDFSEQNPALVEKRVTLTANQAGSVNGIQLNTDVRSGRDTEMVDSSPWLNAPLNLPLENDHTVQPGDELTIELNYELGGGLNNIIYEVVEK